MRRLVFLLTLLLMFCEFALTQNRAPARLRSTDPQFQVNRNGNTRVEKEMERERIKQQAKERQATIKRDTDKLLTLATELKEYVEKTNENVLSVDVVRKAEEIEKLAHHVKEKMRD